MAVSQLTLVAAAAQAEVWSHEMSVQAQALATDNSRPGTAGDKTSDLVLGLQPGLRLAAVGPQLNFRFDASAALVGSARSTIDTSVQPRVDALLGATLVPRLLFLDASANVRQSEADPFGARVTDLSSENRRTTSEYRIAPMLRWQMGSRAQLLARHEESLINNARTGVGNGEADVRGQRSVLRLEREPVPLGAAIELGRDDSRTEGDTIDQRITIESARAQLSYGFADADLVLGAVFGRERDTADLLHISDSIRGVSLHWAPSTRTDLTAQVEHRFFGTGGRVDARFRSPMSALSLRAHREPATASTGFGSASTATDAALLAAGVAAGRTATGEEGAPVPAVAPPPPRSAGEEALGRRGFSAPLPGAIDIAAGYPQLESGFDASLAWLGRRHSVTLQLYTRTLRQISEGLTGPAPLASQDSRQAGGSLSLTRRLAPSMSAAFTVSASRIEGLGSRLNEVTREADAQLTLIDQLSPRTTLTSGLKFERLRSTAAGVNSSDATSLSLGLGHRF